MAARYYNASARPLLTGIGILAALLMAVAVLSAVFDVGYFAAHGASAVERPAFTRRMDVLPPIVVTAPAAP
jgi:hypothetical protein